jgi:hypothetical protein
MKNFIVGIGVSNKFGIRVDRANGSSNLYELTNKRKALLLTIMLSTKTNIPYDRSNQWTYVY